ncbi:hypothetical protein [Actinocrispum wychmicini]|uniref:Uncharacterized protein n=1 Tax=Actinocrispum wychmicini TaxID=1213861 RepID=A0A4R2JYH6_9PSEU|nr:hypothetical protein [Actinocrispum wychmicini]TCO62446.1 hypothetical protein EV192_102584 [Actinocrispum wychmicini]
MAALEALRTPERAQVLATLLKAHPELAAEAEWMATTMLSAASRDEVSAELTSTLAGYEFADMDAEDVGVCDPEDACVYLVEKALDPYHAEIRRRASLGLVNAAHGIAAGVLVSLYGLRVYENSEEHVLGGAGSMAGYADRVTALLRDLDIPLPQDILRAACPTWAASSATSARRP